MKTEQEKTASLISRKLNHYATWSKNLDGTIDVYVPSRGVVIVIGPDLSINARTAKRANGEAMADSATVEQTLTDARHVVGDAKAKALHGHLIGKRCEIPCHYDLWVRGARMGEIVGIRRGNFLIRMDHPQVKRLARIPIADFMSFARIHNQIISTHR